MKGLNLLIILMYWIATSVTKWEFWNQKYKYAYLHVDHSNAKSEVKYLSEILDGCYTVVFSS